MEEFQYHANIPWPTTNINQPNTWFTELYNLENWLNNHIGQHMTTWKYIHSYETLTIGFIKPEHKTFFIIAYTGITNE